MSEEKPINKDDDVATGNVNTESDLQSPKRGRFATICSRTDCTDNDIKTKDVLVGVDDIDPDPLIHEIQQSIEVLRNKLQIPERDQEEQQEGKQKNDDDCNTVNVDNNLAAMIPSSVPQQEKMEQNEYDDEDDPIMSTIECKSFSTMDAVHALTTLVGTSNPTEIEIPVDDNMRRLNFVNLRSRSSSIITATTPPNSTNLIQAQSQGRLPSINVSSSTSSSLPNLVTFNQSNNWTWRSEDTRRTFTRSQSQQARQPDPYIDFLRGFAQPRPFSSSSIIESQFTTPPSRRAVSATGTLGLLELEADRQDAILDEVESWQNRNNSGSDEDDEEYELEVASDSDLPENPIENHDSTSPSPQEEMEYDDNPLNQTFRFDDVENNFDGDKSSNGDNSMMDISFATNNGRKRQCAQCDRSIPSVFIYCLRCFKIRRNWLPKRPRSRRLKQKKKIRNLFRMTVATIHRNGNSSRRTRGGERLDPVVVLDRMNRTQQQATNSLPSDRNIDLNNAFIVSEDNPALGRLDSSMPAGSITICQLLAPQSATNPWGTTESCDLKSILPSLNLNNSQIHNQNQCGTTRTNEEPDCTTEQKVVDNNNKTEKKEIVMNDDGHMHVTTTNLCIICCSSPRNSAFVHNKIAHYAFCYKCADKILKQHGKCPCCRQIVSKLVKIVET